MNKLNKMKEELNFYKADELSSDETPIAPERVVRDLNESIGPEDIVVLDGGNNRMWMTKYFRSKKAGQIIAAGGVTPIGWSVTAALTTQMLKPDKRVISFCGDGGLNTSLYCLEMAAQYELPITYVVLNNSCLGNVMDFQPPDRRLATEYPENDLAGIARAAGCEGYKVQKAEDIKPALNEALRNNKPTLVDIASSKKSHFSLMMS